MNPKSAAQVLGCSVDTIYRLIHSGQLVAYQPGGRRCALLIPYVHVIALRDNRAQVKPNAIRPQQVPEDVG
ncbi:MAG: excisionase family DNA-binding protein [Dehalococcoidia bacterium]|nr:excisionase family DNA-binding protein [Dehalococcoidia bacterium]